MWVVVTNPQKVIDIILTRDKYYVRLEHDVVLVHKVYVKENDDLVKGQVIGWVDESCRKEVRLISHI